VSSESVDWPVLAGQIPPVADSYILRRETGLSAASLPMGGTAVLVPAEDAASGLGERGGIGKTSLAAALALASAQDRTAQLVLWIAATGRDAVISGYAHAQHELDQVPYQGRSPDFAADRFLEWLARTGVPWLVVLDDLGDAAALDGLWPTGPAGRVIVTTGQLDVAAAAPSPRVARVGAFSPREALTYLSARLQQGDPGQRAGAVELVTELQRVPAALGHAGAFIAATGVDCRRYRAQFTERRHALAHAFPGSFSSVLAATWSLSCELADRLPPSGMAWRSLALISMLAPNGIPGAVLTSQAARAYVAGPARPPVDPAEVRSALYNLARTGLVTISDRSAARTVWVHGVVQALTRRHLPAAEGEHAAQAAADALAEIWQSEDVGPVAAQAMRDCTAALRQIAGTFLWEPQCHPALLAAGQSLTAEGLAGPAATYWRGMLAFSQRTLGEEHPQTTQIRDLLAAACEVSGDHQAAIAAYEDALGGQGGTGDPGSSRDIRDRLTRSYLAAGRADDAIQFAEAALRECQQELGPDNPDTLAAHASLASAFLRAGQLDQAATTFQQVAAHSEQVLGASHPTTISARASLVEVYRAAGRYKEAIALGKRILAERERSQGAGHPDTIATRAILAAAYRGANKHKDALRLYERVLADRERGQSADHPDTILARNEVALSYLTTRKLALAITQYERALADSRRALGDDHPITKSTQQSLNEAGAYALSVLGIDLRSPAQPRRA
jgi:tetratricopeptide (TPR) repeat protein